MDTEYLRSAAFWEDDSHFAAGGWNGDLPELDGCGGSVIFRTSGSTGEGKWIVLDKRALLVSAKAVNGWLDVGRGSRWGLALPTNHVGGFSVFARCFEAGCGLAVFGGKWNAADFTEWVTEQGVTHTSLVPTQVHDLVTERPEAPLSLKALVVGGGKLLPEAGQAARDLGWPVLASYGMTEAASQIATQSLACLNTPFGEGPMELLPIWEVRVSGTDLLELRGPALFSGTLEHGFYHPRAGGWFGTSDRVKISGETVEPLGRADSLVKVMGELVDVEAVEWCLRQIVGNDSQLAVIALPDTRREHRLVAVFEGETRTACVGRYNDRVPGVERIMESLAIAEFPRSRLGKIRRSMLAELVNASLE